MSSHDHILSRSLNGPRSWFISQYGDGPFLFASAPISLLMALADFGLASATEATRSKLIMETGTQRRGIFKGGISQMASEAKVRGLQAKAFYAPTLFALDSALNRGRRCIVFGSVYNQYGMPDRHTIYVRGRDTQGKYAVGDSLRHYPTALNQHQLWAFMNYGYHQRGFVAVWL